MTRSQRTVLWLGLALAVGAAAAVRAGSSGTYPSAGGADEGAPSPCADDEILRTNGSVWACEAAPGAGSGDDVSVNGADVTNPNLVSTGDIAFTDTAGDVRADIQAGTVGPTEIATDGVSADELNASGVRDELEAVLRLQSLQGAVTDAQVPDDITVDWGTGAGGVDSDADGTNEIACLTGVCSFDPDDDTTAEFSMTGSSGRFLTGYLEFDEAFASPSCATGDYSIYPNESTGLLQRCENGVVSDLGGDGSGAQNVTLDLADDNSNETTALAEIATSNDTNAVFSNPSANKLLVNLGQNWPTADTADALSANPTDCASHTFATTIDAAGNLTCANLTDADIPNDITITAVTSARAVDADADGTNEVSVSAPTLSLDPDDDGVTEFSFNASTGKTVVGYLDIDETYTAPACSAGDYLIYPDESAGILKKCENGSLSNLDNVSGGGGGGSAILLDLGDDGGNDSVDLAEIATTGDTNAIFSEPSADKLLIQVGNNWPQADQALVADELTLDPEDCATNQFATTIASTGDLTCASLTDADIPDTITIAHAADATGVDVDDDGNLEFACSGSVCMIDSDDDGAAEFSVDADGNVTTVGTVTSGDPGDNSRGISLTDNTTSCADPASGDTSICSIGGAVYYRDTGGSSFKLVGEGEDLTLTGAIDAGGAASFELPNGSNPTVDATGEIAFDTTDSELVIMGNSNVVAIPISPYEVAVVENLSASDDGFPIWQAGPGGAVIQSAFCTCVGTCTTEADITFQDQSGNAMTGTITCEDISGGETETSITAGGTLSANELLEINVTNTPTTGDNYTIRFHYRRVRQ